MQSITRRQAMATMAGAALLRAAGTEWISLFDGSTMKGWKASENASSWSVKDSCLTAAGPRSHLFYTGPVQDAKFRNFELETELRTRPGTNSGVYFGTTYQESGWPNQGFEVQVNNTHHGEGSYEEHKKTGSLYGVRNQYKSLVRDDEWFRMNILVRGKNVQVRVNDTLVVDFNEPTPPIIAPDGRGRFVQTGTFALQGHDAGSHAMFRSVRVRPLPDSASAPGAVPSANDEIARELQLLGAANYPVVDYHTHLKAGLTLDQLLARSRETGIFCGIGVNCGKSFPVKDGASARQFVDGLKGAPAFTAMQAEGREWTEMFDRETVALFDYVFTDSMTWTDDRGRRMRLWMPQEVGEIPDAQAFMDMLVNRAVGILEREPVDIYANPTFLPEAIVKEYEALWTDDRIRKVVMAAKKGGVAIELNNRYRLPGARFVKMAKAEGLKFSFGTNNTGPQDLGRCEYGLEMVKAAQLKWQDFFTPKPVGERAIDRKPLRG